MFRKESFLARWAGLVVVAALLTLFLIFLGGQPVAAGEGTSPQMSPLNQWESAQPHRLTTKSADRAVQAFESGSISLEGQPQVNPGYTVDLTYNSIWGLVNPGDVVTVTRTADGAYGSGEADGVGFFWTRLWFDNGQPADIAGGDSIDIYVDGALAATVSPLTITGAIDVLADQVSGNIEGAGAGIPVTVTVGSWGQIPVAGAPQETTTTDVDGDFDVTFASIDLKARNLVAVDYNAGGNYVRSYLYPDPAVFAVEQYNQVAGYAPLSQMVTATVYSIYPGNVRWQGTASAGWPLGFYTIANYEEGAQPGDVVEVEFEDGTLISTTLPNLSNLSFDVGLDQVSGIAPEGEAVHISMWQQGNGEQTYAETTAVAGVGDTFQAAFATADLHPRDEVLVAISDAEGNDTQLRSGPPYVDAWLDPLTPWDCVMTRVDEPNVPVTVSIQTASGVYTRETPAGVDAGNSGGCFVIWHQGEPIQFSPGDTVTVQSGTWAGSVVLADVSWYVDTANDQVTGDAPPGEIEVAVRQWYAGSYLLNGSAMYTATAASPYTADFAGFDVRDGGSLEVRHHDPATDFGTHYFSWWELRYQYFEADQWGVSGQPPTADEYLVADLYEADGSTLIATTDFDYDGDPWRFSLHFEGQDIMPGYWVTITGDSGWTASLQVPYLTVEADEDTEMITGQGPTAMIMVEHGWNDGQEWNNHFVPVDDATGLYALDRSFFGGDVRSGDQINAIYQAPGGDTVRQSVSWPRMHVNYGEDWVLGEYPIGYTFWITVTDGGGTPKGYAQVDTTPGGAVWFGNGFMTEDGNWDGGQRPNIVPNDWVHFRASDGYTNTIQVGTITGELDAEMDTAWGTITAPGFTEPISGFAGAWGFDWVNFTVDPNGGAYFVNFAEDLQPGWSIDAGYVEPDGDMVSNGIYPLDLIMNVNYGHDWVEGNYEPGHTVWITVTQSDQVTVKAKAELQTQVIPWWGGQSGFSTSLEDLWLPTRPDIEPGDYVLGRVDTGYTSSVRIGTITGDLDIDANTISGQVYADWFSELLEGACGVWAENGPNLNFMVDPAGGSYSCNFSPFDVQPGQDVYVQYREPDGDWVYNVFTEPAPNMRVEKWAEGSGQATPGGPAIYTIRYRNDGNAEATTILLTDTLPLSTTYVTDDSDVAPTFGSGWVAWTLGPLDPDEERQFRLVLTNTAGPNSTLLNQADIWTLYDQDSGNNHAEAQVEVVAGQPDLYVNKNPNPGDPAQGQTMLWEIDYGNNGPVASGLVILTDTLPQDTSIVGWESENGYDLWIDHSTASQLILEAPTVPGNWGDRILLRLLVSAPPGTQLTNTVEITTADDSDLNNNWRQRNDVWVGDPRWDAYVDKNLGWGRLVPGGEMEYNLHVRNGGNMATSIVVTDTLPDGPSFDQSWNCSGPTCVPFPPDYVDNQVAVWDLGVMEPGEWVNINVRLAIGSDVEPGTVLTNCADVAIDGDDNWPYNNSDCVVDTVRDYGPNLRIDKYYRWNWEGQLEYTIDFWNLGSTTLYDVTITDTLPDDTSFSGNWWHWFWQGIGFNQVGDQLIWTIDQLDPTWSSGLRYQVDLDGDIVGQEGLCFTNAAQAPIPGDVYPEDNYEEVTACTGPDVYVEKWLSGGEPRPGAIVTFTVEFGNQSPWPWNGDDQYRSHLTETLPAEMAFITATAPWNPDDRWQPQIIDGNTIVWDWGTMWADNWWRFDVVAKIADTVEGGDVLTNIVEAYGDSPNDVEPNYDNNVFELPVTILGPSFTVEKAYESSQVAGTPVTYTLTVMNLGNEPGTNVLLGDKVPTSVTYGGGSGSLVSGSVNWTFSSIAADGGTSTGWFWGTLACAGTVTNDAYRIISSDQGVDTPDGSPVSLTIVAPTLSPSFYQSAAQVNVGEPVYFADTSTTDGSAIVAWSWDFGDGETATGATASHAYNTPGSYDVTLTVTDTCGYGESSTLLDAVTIGQYRIFLPIVVKNLAP